MRRILVIGIGPGDPGYLTVQAIEALNQADVFFINDKGDDTAELVRIRKDICERYITNRSYRIVETHDPERDPTRPSYQAGVESWHTARAATYEALIQAELTPDACGAFLVWGDPSLYDSTLRVLEQILARGVTTFDYDVIPGITSIQALAAKHRIPINDIGGSIHVTTGRRLARDGLPDPADTTVVMLDGGCSFTTIDDDVEIYWGANLGTEHEVLISGALREVAERIEGARAAVKHARGWVMDTYLLRRGHPRP
jgi:precorrin-6A synthase